MQSQFQLLATAPLPSAWDVFAIASRASAAVCYAVICTGHDVLLLSDTS